MSSTDDVAALKMSLNDVQVMQVGSSPNMP
jgi:hypothetical protein